MSFDFNVAFEYTCDKYNFRPCRLDNIIENNNCPANQILIGDSYVLYDIFFLILSVIVAILFVVLLPCMKPYEVLYYNQRKARGTWYWKSHLFISGIYLLVWGISVSITSIYDNNQKVFIVLAGIFQNWAQSILIFCALVDTLLIPQKLMQKCWWHILVGVITCIIGLIYLIELWVPTRVGLMFLGIVVPVGCSSFYFLSMIPVLIYRKEFLGLVYLIFITICNIGHQIFNLTIHGLLCTKTLGYFSGSSLSVVIFAFYRIFVQLYFQRLKEAERFDGLTEKRRLSEELSNLPLPIEISDYSYSYTYTDSNEDYMKQIDH